MHPRRPLGLAFALTSAATFGVSGILAASLLEAGWSSGAVTLVRIAGGALVLLAPTLWLLRGRWGAVLRSWREVLVLGLLAVALCQLAFFSAVAYISPALALLIEFLGPVRLKDVEEAQRRIVGITRRLKDAGEIVVAGPGEGEQVVG